MPTAKELVDQLKVDRERLQRSLQNAQIKAEQAERDVQAHYGAVQQIDQLIERYTKEAEADASDSESSVPHGGAE